MEPATVRVAERALARLEARVAELERDNARLDRFAAVAAHELTEPAVIAQEYAALLLDRLGTDADPQSRSDLQALSRGAAHMRLIVETLLQEARVADRSLARVPVDLSELVHDGRALLANEIRARDACVVVGPLPTVLGDELLLGILMKNLLSNAVRYGARGGTVRVGAARHERGWRVSVTNQGPPIPAAERRHIFEPFQRGRAGRSGGGAGLGLAICRAIVERHGGAIGLRVSPADNRFHFTLPP
jgi:signal transduction histidine kinase